jgi:uncharacterized peroxidase-related enzyme
MAHHGAALRRLTRNEELVKTLWDDYRRADLSAQDRAMLDYAVKLTSTPWEMSREDIERLREAGFTDAAILDINQVAGYFNLVNRLIDGLGVELESGWRPDELP